MKSNLLLATVLLTACGSQEHVQIMDRFTSENIGHEIGKLDNDIGAESNRARKQLSDDGINSEAVQRGLSDAEQDTSVQLQAARDQTGEEANKTRDYLYPRGVEEMRHGDQSTTTHLEQIDDNLNALTLQDKLYAELLASMAATNASSYSALAQALAEVAKMEGPAGADGKDGVDGENGAPAELPTFICGYPEFDLTSEESEESNVVVLDCPKGEQGEAGAPGQDGQDGAPGQDGENGQDGSDAAACTVASATVSSQVCSHKLRYTVSCPAGSISFCKAE